MAILLQIKDLMKEYNGEQVFSGLSFAVSEKQKIGVVGVNGAGKSTLFKIITQEETADQGEIIIHDKASIGYLKQNDDYLDNESALDYLMRQGDCPDWEAKKLASRFELDEAKLLLNAKGLSGGWQMRLRLCGMLLKQPNLFLLDEPSNYLDLNTIILLESYLNSYKGSFLVISHDREFLKNTCDETLEISKTGCYHYRGKIDNYLSFKEEKLASFIKTNESIKKQQEHWQEFVDRFRYKDSKARQAQSVIRKIAKLEEKRLNIETKAKITRIIIPQISRKKNFALKIDDLSIGYNNKALVSNINFDCRAGEKLAVLGLNGQGKTTFLKSLAGSLELISGTYKFASNYTVASHGQDEMEAMDIREQAGSYLRRLASPEIKTESVLKMAGDFLFEEEELKKTISVLSGGEKSRLLLAGLLLSKPDVLILDEPTCHLDFETTEALARAIKAWNGTVLFASHDRTFSKLVATDIVEISNGKAKRIHEEYDDYVLRLEKELANKSQEEKKINIPSENKSSYLEDKARKRELKVIERQIKEMEKYRKELMAYFLEHYHDYKKEKVQELEDLNRRIKDKEELWLIINEDLNN